MEHLRSSKLKPKGLWAKDELKAGFMKYAEDFGRFPTAVDIDTYEFLPSSRSIQRSYGGLVRLRRELFPDEVENFTKGKHRSDIARETFINSQNYEEKFYEDLCKSLDTVAVHEHKIIRPGRVASDFFIYKDDESGVCIDLFYAKDLYSLRGVINYKAKHYQKVSCPVLLVLIDGNVVAQDQIDRILSARREPLPSHIQVMTERLFWNGYYPRFVMESIFRRLERK